MIHRFLYYVHLSVPIYLHCIAGKSFSKTITAILTSVKMREEGKQHGKNPHGVPGALSNPIPRPGFPGAGGVANPITAGQR